MAVLPNEEKESDYLNNRNELNNSLRSAIKIPNEEFNYLIHRNNVDTYLKSLELDQESMQKFRKKIHCVNSIEEMKNSEELFDCSTKSPNKDNQHEILRLIGQGANVNHRNKRKGDFPLIMVAKNNDLESFKNLIRAGANINQVNDYKTTALMRAARCGNIEMVKILIALGADINAKCLDGDTAIMSAALHNQHKCVELLAKAQAHINTSDLKNRVLTYLSNESKVALPIPKEKEITLTPMDLIEEAQLKLQQLKK